MTKNNFKLEKTESEMTELLSAYTGLTTKEIEKVFKYFVLLNVLGLIDERNEKEFKFTKFVLPYIGEIHINKKPEENNFNFEFYPKDKFFDVLKDSCFSFDCTELKKYLEDNLSQLFE